MARLEFTKAPTGLSGKPYSYYRDWLEVNFYKELCSYCLLNFPSSLHIEHFEPQKYAPRRINDPANLLLGCPWCNSGKQDYHPNHRTRRRLRTDASGHNVIDIREDDFGELFELRHNGTLLARNGAQKDRAKFNLIRLLRHDTPKYVNYRKKCLEYADACECLIGDPSNASQNALNILVEECAERYLFFQAFNVPISDKLKELIQAYLDQNKPVIVS